MYACIYICVYIYTYIYIISYWYYHYHYHHYTYIYIYIYICGPVSAEAAFHVLVLHDLRISHMKQHHSMKQTELSRQVEINTESYDTPERYLRDRRSKQTYFDTTTNHGIDNNN